MSNKREAGYYHVLIHGVKQIAYNDGNVVCPWHSSDLWYSNDEVQVLDETPIKLLSGKPSPTETIQVKLTIEPQNMALWTEFTKNMAKQAEYFKVLEG